MRRNLFFVLAHNNSTTLSAAAQRRTCVPSMTRETHFDVTHSLIKIRQSKQLNVCRALYGGVSLFLDGEQNDQYSTNA